MKKRERDANCKVELKHLQSAVDQAYSVVHNLRDHARLIDHAATLMERFRADLEAQRVIDGFVPMVRELAAALPMPARNEPKMVTLARRVCDHLGEV